MRSFISALLAALAITGAYALPATDDPNEHMGLEIHDNAYCNNASPRYLSLKDTDCHELDGQSAYVKAVRWRDDLRDDALQCWERPGECPNGGPFYGVPFRGGGCNYVGNMNGLRVNYP